jgi:hypothetical protein
MDPIPTSRILIATSDWPRRTKSEIWYAAFMDEGRKRVLAIVAGILVARHLKTTEDIFDSKPSPRT